MTDQVSPLLDIQTNGYLDIRYDLLNPLENGSIISPTESIPRNRVLRYKFILQDYQRIRELASIFKIFIIKFL